MDNHEVLHSVADVQAQLNDIHRRLNNLIIPGRVKQLSSDNRRIKVNHGACVTPFIHWLAPAMGEVNSYRAPSIGEQCLLLNLTGGMDTAGCVALFGIPSAQFSPTSATPTHTVTAFPDGTLARYDHEQHHLTLEVNGQVTVNAADTVTIAAQQAAHVSANKIFLNSGGGSLDEVVTRQTICAFTGTPHASCGNTVFVSKG